MHLQRQLVENPGSPCAISSRLPRSAAGPWSCAFFSGPQGLISSGFSSLDIVRDEYCFGNLWERTSLTYLSGVWYIYGWKPTYVVYRCLLKLWRDGVCQSWEYWTYLSPHAKCPSCCQNCMVGLSNDSGKSCLLQGRCSWWVQKRCLISSMRWRIHGFTWIGEHITDWCLKELQKWLLHWHDSTFTCS